MGFLDQKIVCPVNISNDWTTGICSHAAIPPTPPINFSFELPAPQLWPPGYLINQNSLTTTVYHKQQTAWGWIVLDGHDQGVFLLHLTIPVWANLRYIVIIPFSSREIMFIASSVQFNEKPVGCSLWPIFPMLTCGDPCGAPLAFPFTNLLNTLKVGMSLLDIIMGCVNIGISMAFDILFDKLSKSKKFKNLLKKGDKLLNKIGFKTVKAFANKIEKAVQKKVSKFLTKIGFNKLVKKAVLRRLTKTELKKMSKGQMKYLLQKTKKEVVKEIVDKLNPLSTGDIAKSGMKGLAGFSVGLFTDNPTYKTFKMKSSNPYLGGSIEWSKKDGIKATENILFHKAEYSAPKLNPFLKGEWKVEQFFMGKKL